MKYIDIVSYGLTAERYAVTLTDGVQAAVPTGPVTLTKPFHVFVIDAALAGQERITSSTWSSDVNNIPQITVSFSTPGISRDCTVIVLYKI
jgi:hypothetical protein